VRYYSENRISLACIEFRCMFSKRVWSKVVDIALSVFVVLVLAFYYWVVGWIVLRVEIFYATARLLGKWPVRSFVRSPGCCRN